VTADHRHEVVLVLPTTSRLDVHRTKFQEPGRRVFLSAQKQKEPVRSRIKGAWEARPWLRLGKVETVRVNSSRELVVESESAVLRNACDGGWWANPDNRDPSTWDRLRACLRASVLWSSLQGASLSLSLSLSLSSPPVSPQARCSSPPPRSTWACSSSAW